MIFLNLSRLSHFGQLIAMFVFTVSGVILLTATGLAFAGILPWLELDVSYYDQPLDRAGQAFQIGVTALVILLAVYVPMNRHVMMLEASHREFSIGMDDITQAYQAVHYADRRAMFEMEREFDSIRERFEYLRKHPDLPEIDAELLTIAAQMSHQSRELAKGFSEEKIARARESLLQRRRDAEELETRIQTANATSRELRREIDDVEFAESSAASQLRRLREDLTELEARIAGEGARKGNHLRPVTDAVS